MRFMITAAATATLCFGGVAVADHHESDEKKMDIVDTAVKAGQFKTLVKAVKAAGLAETLKGEGPFTVFAPTDEAFAKLPEGTLDSLLKNKDDLKKILLFHVVKGKVTAKDAMKLDGKMAETAAGQKVGIKVKGDKVMVGKATVVKADVMASNGIIHVIDTVLVPTMNTALVDHHEKGETKMKDIVATAKGAKDFTILCKAVEAAGLTETLQGKGPFTVFAPTDKAFKAIPEDKLNALLKDKEALTKVLTYHVVPGKVMAKDVVKLESAKTVNGKKLNIETEDEGAKVMVEGAQVVKTDIEASNGIIHVIDKVLLP